jgi:exodeoxyribonuclease VII large subunit
MEGRLDREAATLISYLTRPVLVHPDRLIEPLAEEVSRHRLAARRACSGFVRAIGAHLEGLAANLRALSPQSTFDRGYSVVRSAGGEVVRDAAGLEAGSAIAIRFARGSAGAEVTSVSP